MKSLFHLENKMGKAKRKMRPQPPWWWILDNDNC